MKNCLITGRQTISAISIPPPIMTLEELKRKFAENNVPLRVMHSDEKRYVELLLKQINSGEVELAAKDYVMAQRFSVVIIKVRFCINKTLTLKLVEKRTNIHGHDETVCEEGISKRIRINEEVDSAAKRCFQEKLGFKNYPRLKLLSTEVEDEKIQLDGKYPCFCRIIKRHIFSYDLPRDLYKPEGYTFERSDKINRKGHFHWVPDQKRSNICSGEFIRDCFIQNIHNE